MATNGESINNASSLDSTVNNNNSVNLVSQPTTTAILDPESPLKVDIREDNGAIDTVLFGGSDYFNPGSPVSDFGLQNSTDTSSFVRNDTSGFTQQPVTVSEDDSSVVVTGTYTGGGVNVDFRRTYTQIDGLNVFEVETEFTNNGSDVDLRYFDTFDPGQGIDQGSGFSTFNDVLTLDTGSGEAKIGQATESGGLTFILGSVNGDATVASGNPFSISSGFTKKEEVRRKIEVGMSIIKKCALWVGRPLEINMYSKTRSAMEYCVLVFNPTFLQYGSTSALRAEFRSSLLRA